MRSTSLKSDPPHGHWKSSLPHQYQPLNSSTMSIPPLALAPSAPLVDPLAARTNPRSEYPMSSLSSADSAFGFSSSAKQMPSQPLLNTTTSSLSSPSPSQLVLSSRPPSHQQPPLHTPVHSTAPTHTTTSPTTNTPTSIPLQLLKKGIVFEDENDDTSVNFEAGHARRRVDHRRTAQGHMTSNQQGEDDDGGTTAHRKGAGGQGGSSPSPKKKQSKENKKLTKLPNGALVKRR
jgi:hypothetical protein